MLAEQHKDVCRRRGVRVLFLILIAVLANATTVCWAQGTVSGLTRQEKFVLDQVARGKCVAFSAEPLENSQSDLCRGRAVRADGYSPGLTSEFIEKLLTGNFKETRLSRFVVIDGAIFHGQLSLRDADIPMEVRLTNGRFDDDLDFSTSHFRGPLFLNDSKFTKSHLNFNSMSVVGGLFLDRVEVPGKAEFYHLDEKGDVYIRNANFTNSEETVQFGESEINGDMFIEGTTFKGSLSIVQSNLRGLNIKDVKVENTLDLGHAHIDRVFALGFIDTPHPPILAGLIYGDLSVAGVDVRLRDLIKEESKTNYNAQSYSQLEDYYRLHGLPQLADKVFIESKEIERRMLPWRAKLYSWFLEQLVGYGRKPQRALGLSLLVVLAGTVIFWHRRDMELQDSKSTRTIYNPFWYSLDLLTPIIDMDAAKVWMPRENWRFGRNYARVQRILGWILIPLGFAAITGIIK